MGTKRVGLARTQALIENLKRELQMNQSQLVGGKRKVIALTNAATTAKTLTADDSGALITLDPSTDTATTITVTLPAVEAGLEFEWCFLADAVNAAADVVFTTSGASVDFEGAFVCTDGTSGIQEANAGTSTITMDATNVKTWWGHSGRLICDGTDWQAVITVSNDAKDCVGTAAGAAVIYILS